MAGQQHEPPAVDDTRVQALALLAEVRDLMHTRFGGHTARLQQLDAHLDTAVMVVDHIHDEDGRDQPATTADGPG